MCFEAAPAEIPAHIKLLQAEVELYCALHFTIGRALDDPDLRHMLPGLYLDLDAQHVKFLLLVADQQPDAALAMRRGLRSTQDLHPSERTAP